MAKVSSISMAAAHSVDTLLGSSLWSLGSSVRSRRHGPVSLDLNYSNLLRLWRGAVSVASCLIHVTLLSPFSVLVIHRQERCSMTRREGQSALLWDSLVRAMQIVSGDLPKGCVFSLLISSSGASLWGLATQVFLFYLCSAV